MSAFVVPNVDEFRRLVQEGAQRRNDALRIYRPRPEQVPFHTSSAVERLVRGGNRSGKTVCAAAEVAAAALGQPLIGPDGKCLPLHYPPPPLTIWLIGFEQKHVARMGRKLFAPGLFRCIKHRRTGELRCWRGYSEEPDLADKTVPSPPFIPGRMIVGYREGYSWKEARGVAWEAKAEGVFSSVQLTNGTVLYAFPSSSEATIGDALDLIWIDEDVKDPAIIPELIARLADLRGRFIWSTWPRMKNKALRNMDKAAKEAKRDAAPDPFEINLKFSDNPYIPPDYRQKIIARWKQMGEAVWRARDLGEMTEGRALVFPTFDVDVHTLPTAGDRKSPLEDFLAKRDWEVPAEWTWYLGIDPGHTRQAAIPLVIPPPTMFPDCAIVPGEVFLEIADADDMAGVLAQRWSHVRWEAFVMDPRMGFQTAVGTSTKIIAHYEKAFAKHSLKCRSTDSHILFGLDNPTDRNMTIREWLAPQANGFPKLYLIRSETPQLQREFELYRKQVTRDDVKEKIIRENNDCIDALGYIVSYAPVWVDEYDDTTWHPPDVGNRVIQMLKQRFGLVQTPEKSISMGMGVAHPNYP